jgi:hypothetical protein
MKAVFRLACVYFASVAITFGTTPLVITFDDLTPGSLPGHDEPWEGPIQNGYEGFQWNNFWVIDTVLMPYTCGDKNGVVSLNNVAFNGYGNSALFSDGQFNLNSAYLGATWNDGLQVEVQGFAGATLLYDNTYVVNTTGSTLINFNYLGINQVNFISSGGTPHGYSSGSGTQFMLDNLSVTIVPEPSMPAVAGLGAVLLLLRRSK